MKKIVRCSRCIMDNSSDDTIIFDKNGFCNYCSQALIEMKNNYFPYDGDERLNELLNKIKKSGEKRKYDCIMGISGGLDSSYLLYKGYLWGLRILVVHIDDGYDTEISKKNIEKLIKKTKYDYKVIKPDKQQYNNLLRAYLKASVPNIAIPQGNILFAFLYDEMKKNKIKYFLSGYNFSLECILQKGNTYKASDVINIKDINRRFGNKNIDKLKFISTLQLITNKKIRRLKTEYPLNYINYQRDLAFEELNNFCGFEYYGRKHLENILTAFIQLYWFPKKFGVDKRTSHLSSMIVTKQLTRDEALRELLEPLYDKEQMDNYIDIIKKNLHISDAEFLNIMKSPTHQHYEYETEDRTILFKIINTIKKIVNIIC